MKRLPYFVAATLVAMALAPQVRAAVIYSDNFDGTAGNVGGRAPDAETGAAGGSATAVWTSDTAVSANPDALWTASGGTYTGTGTTQATLGAVSTGADANLITNAFLPFVPVSGVVYDLHAAILSSSVGASTNWLGLEFAPANMNGHTAGGGASALSNTNGNGLIILKGSGQVQSFGGGGTANAEINSAAGFLTAGQYNTVDILLDTTSTAWKVSWLVNGVTPSGVGGTSFTYGTNPAIGNVVFGSNKLTGAVSDFSLTFTPEPASLTMLGVGAMGLLMRRRR